MGTQDDWFWADGEYTVNYLATGGGGGSFGFMTNLVNGRQLDIGAGFQGWYAGSVSYAGMPGPNVEYGPAHNGYSEYSGVVGQGYYVTGVVGGSTTGVGVYGQAEDDPDSAIPQNLSAGVFGAANTGSGVIGWSTTWNGVEGWAYQGTAVLGVSVYDRGVHGASTWQQGVQGWSVNDTGVIGGSGQEGEEGPTVPNLGPAGVMGTSNQRHAVIGTSNDGAGVVGYSTNFAGVVGIGSGASSAGIFYGNVIVNGTLTANVKNGVVPFPDGSQRVLHCMESPEHWFEDFGSAKLKNGSAVVKLDADFAKVVKRGDYRVFLTPEGDCRGLYVRRKSANSFEVRELTGGKSSVAFSYRIVGRRKDIKGHRRFAKIDTRPPLPTAAARAPRKPAPASAGRREFTARLEKKARERTPKGAAEGRARMRAKGPRPNIERLMQQLAERGKRSQQK